LLLREVGGDGDGAAAGLVDEVDGLGDRALEAAVAGFDGAGGDGDDRALPRHPPSDRLADATAGAGDDRDLAVHGSHHVPPRCRCKCITSTAQVPLPNGPTAYSLGAVRAGSRRASALSMAGCR